MYTDNKTFCYFQLEMVSLDFCAQLQISRIVIVHTEQALDNCEVWRLSLYDWSKNGNVCLLLCYSHAVSVEMKWQSDMSNIYYISVHMNKYSELKLAVYQIMF